MTLQLIIGRNDVEKSTYVIDEMKRKLQENRIGQPIFYIAPEQMTFAQEYALLQDDAVKGSVRAEVISFSRLAWRVLQETGGATKQFISSTGIQMMLRKIVDERTEKFEMFQKALDKHGFIQELESIITEFKRHCITPDMLLDQIHYAQENIPLKSKLTDLYYIYEQLTYVLQDKYIDGEDQLQLLIDKIQEAKSLENADIYIDGFYRFTPKELQIIEQLLQTCKRVTITLITDKQSVADELSELDLFHQTATTYQTLKQMAQTSNVPLAETIQLQGDETAKEPFSHLEKHFTERPAPSLRTKEKLPIILAEAIHPHAEVEGVAQEILRLVREEGYRYRDMVIYLRETDIYNDLLQTMFADYHIPIFIDEKKTMLNHPLVEFIRSAFEVVESNWRYDAMFRLLKTGFIPQTDEAYPLTTDAIDELENYVLEYGIRRRHQWIQTEKWIYQRFRGFSEARQTDKEKENEQKINAYRHQVVEAIQLFDEQMQKKSTVRAYCEAIYLFLEQMEIPQKLEKNRERYEQAGFVERAREEEQVWQAIIHLLDEMVEMIGDETLSFQTMKAIMEAGLEVLEFSHVPPTMDHVIVGTIDQSRIEKRKCAFLLGVNEGIWPMKPTVDGMINESEREFLKQFGMELAESTERVLLDDQFYMYLAFTSATDYLWVSYVLSDGEGKGKIASPMIGRLQAFFPQIKEPILLQDPDELQMAHRFITTVEQTRLPLTVQLARYIRGYPLDDIWWATLQWYVQNEPKHSTSYKVLQSLFYDNTPVKLSDEAVRQLYPKRLQTSVSRLEMYYRCSYQHFAQYSLQLEDRRTYTLEAPDIGQLFHEALKVITDWVQAEKGDFSKLSKADSTVYAKKSMAHLAPVLQHQILSSSNRYKYIQRKLQDIIAQAIYMLSEQARMSGFSPVGLELGFGLQDKDGLEPLVIPLANDYELVLRGRIDRVDQSTYNDQLYLRIIDYKSSSRGLDLAEVYYGLALQMLTYLDVVISQAKNWLGKEASPAGILYFHVHDAMLNTTEKLTDETIERELFKQYKMDGLVSAKEAVAKQMDTTLESGRSDVVPIGFRKDGAFYAGSKVADEQTFATLRHHIHDLIARAGILITSGDIQLNPYENNDMTACTFCSFKSVCQFDPALMSNNYRKLVPLKDDEVFKRMNE